MSGKLVVAVILALQVTASLCELPQPSKELVDKYTDLKESVYKLLAYAGIKAKEALEPLAQHIPQSQAAKDYVEELQGKPHVQSVVKVATGVAGELVPLVDKVRMAGLGLYETYARPWLGTYLDQGVTAIKEYVNTVVPAEQP
uniref:14kDa apolipoprotein n=1 Tax=Anguilla japonica TaxID=7937 RepID=Q98TG0_ANGJA|nr:14kDa apolipoprotein [Anguilla japonica]BAH58379.1 apolipoprotein A-II [Anguilla japonica]